MNVSRKRFVWGLILGSFSGLATGATIYVNGACGSDANDGLNPTCPSGPKLTLSAAVNVASSGDTILVAPYVYTGPDNKNLDFGGRSITLRCASIDPEEPCVIDAESSGRAFCFHAQETEAAVVEGITIRNANAFAGIPSTPASCNVQHGGAVLVLGTAGPTIRKCVLEGNIARNGGAMQVSAQSQMRIEDTVFRGNFSNFGFHGGAIHIQGNGGVVIRRCTFAENISTGNGGAITVGRVEGFADPSQPGTRFENCLMERNTADGFGGAFYALNKAKVTFLQCDIAKNSSTLEYGGGGALAVEATAAPVAPIILLNSRLAGNAAADRGGGIYLLASVPGTLTDLRLVNTLLYENQAYEGGAVFADAGALLRLQNCTMADNVAENRGGGLFAATDVSSVLVRNSIFWGNTAPNKPGQQIYLEYEEVPSGLFDIKFSNVQRRDPPVIDIFPSDSMGNDQHNHNIGTDQDNDNPNFLLPAPGNDPDEWNDVDYRINRPTRVIDSGNNLSIAADIFDLDGDSDLLETVPVDLAFKRRLVDDPETVNAGAPVELCTHVDMGAYEFAAEPDCPTGSMVWSQAAPAPWTIDARQPHPLYDSSPSERQGIGSVNEAIEILLEHAGQPVAGANSPLCWGLTETGIEEVDPPSDPLASNYVHTVVESPSGHYALRLLRPISAGEWTTISYLGDTTGESNLTYGSLPGDVTGDGLSETNDLLKFLDYLAQLPASQPYAPPHGLYGSNIDRLGSPDVLDILRLQELLSGAGLYLPWQGRQLPEIDCWGRAVASFSCGPADTPAQSEEDYLAILDSLLELGLGVPPATIGQAKAIVMAFFDARIKVESAGSRYFAVTVPNSVGSVALRVTGECGVAETQCVSHYVQPGGNLALEAYYQQGAGWQTIYVSDYRLAPNRSYAVHAEPLNGSVRPAEWGTLWAYGDTSNDNIVEVTDVLCVLGAYSGNYPPSIPACTFYSANLAPCDDVDDRVELADVLAVLGAYADNPDPCSEPCSPAPSAPETGGSSIGPESTANVISLTPDPTEVNPNGTVTLEAWIAGPEDLRAYQVGIEISGGDEGTLSLQSLSIVTQHEDFVFDELDYVTAVSAADGRFTAALYEGGVNVGENTRYLGRFVLRASKAASGTFNVALRTADTSLYDSESQPLSWSSGGDVEITVTDP